MGVGKSSKEAPPTTPPLGSSDCMLEQIRALVTTGSLPSDMRLEKEAQRRFWSIMREKLSVNKSSSGLFVLDQIAVAILDDSEDIDSAFTDPVVLLPKPSTQQEAPNAYVHKRFSNMQGLPDTTSLVLGKHKGPVVLLPKPSTQQEAPNAYAHKRFSNTQGLPDIAPLILGKRKVSPPKSSSDGKQKVPSVISKDKTDANMRSPLTPTLKAIPTVFEGPKIGFSPLVLADNTPLTVLQDVEAIHRRAANVNKLCFELAYPWEHSKVWYDPSEYHELHVAHWRFWMENRSHFFDWQLNAPLKTSFSRRLRRKLKQQACTDRLKFLSQCIETWGYYNFLERYEGVENDRLLMWMGGQPGKNSPDAKIYKGPTIQNLSNVYSYDPETYHTRVKNALKPFKLDQGGFLNITSLLEYTNALDPEAKIENRLTDEALAWVRHDVCSNRDPINEWWVGDRLTGVWSKLISSNRIEGLERVQVEKFDKGDYNLPRIPESHISEKLVGYTPLIRCDGSYTAEQATPLKKSEVESSSDSESDVEPDDEMPPPSKKSKS
ncbi:hypothetical protein P3T76_007615 [Phytophthora citrophthora]|uniref:Uncharacterized protein n=1 Tax=Phytophthora citrophthora TaxID=4793 RepID=A0AAD9GM20_9STRA|nr:hypothetical protein P3T76_007615 [Phytophthora citrophthora]